jgi:hypothetical protein
MKASNSQSWVNKNYKNTKAQNALFSMHNKTVMSQCHKDNMHAHAMHPQPTQMCTCMGSGLASGRQ